MEAPQPRFIPDRELTAASDGITLPADLARVAARRIGAVALTYSGAYLAFEILFTFTRIYTIPHLMVFNYTVAAIGIVSGLGLFHLSRKWEARAALVIKLGLAFEVYSSFLIALAEMSAPPPNDYLHGHSAIAFWISTFALVAPAPYRPALAAALCSAAMAPIGLAVNMAIRGYPSPPLAIWLMYSLAPFLMAVLCTSIARWIYQLGVQLQAARDLGAYQMIEQLGKGGMGEVWKARHRFLAREAAIKLIASSDAQQAALNQKRFEREARAIARLECPHTVTLYDFGTTPQGQQYFAMELVRGLNLDEVVKRYGPLPAARVRHILLQVLDSLAEAHGAGLTHRDIKPSNILLARVGLEFDFVKVVDFGLVKAADSGGATQLTLEHTTLGTPAFMAPEMAQAREELIDGRTDLYSLGCVAYWLLTGQPVFPEKTPMAVILKHVSESPARPSERTENPIPEDLEAVVMQCLEKSPERRPAGALTMREQLSQVAGSEWTASEAEAWWQTHQPSLAYAKSS